MRRRLRIISVLLIAVFLLTSVLYLIWDNNKSSFEPMQIDKDVLHMPEERQRMKIRLKSRALKAL